MLLSVSIGEVHVRSMFSCFELVDPVKSITGTGVLCAVLDDPCFCLVAELVLFVIIYI